MNVESLVHEAADQLFCDLQAIASERSRESDSQSALTTAMDRCLHSLRTTELWGRANQEPSRILWNRCEELLCRGVLQLRARTKPLGYAGDHVMLERIIRRWTCADPLGRLMDEYFQSQSAPQAVRNRTDFVRDAIVTAIDQWQGRGNPIHVVSIGSGPAMDVHFALARRAGALGHVTVNLLDYDPGGLQRAGDNLSEFSLGDRLNLVQTNLVRLPRRKDLDDMIGHADLLACVGLFDYLQAAEAEQLLATLCRQAAQGGQVIVCNFSPGNQSRGYMEWIGNWYLEYRDAEAMDSLGASVSKLCQNYQVIPDQTGASHTLVVNC